MTPRTAPHSWCRRPAPLAVLLCLWVACVRSGAEQHRDGDVGVRGRRLSQVTLDGVDIPSSVASRNPLAGLLSNEGPMGANPTNFLQRAFDSQGKVQQVCTARCTSSHTGSPRSLAASFRK